MKLAASVVRGETSGPVGRAGASGAGKRTAVADGARGGGRDEPCAGAGGFSAGCVCDDTSGAARGGLSRGGNGADASGGDGEGSTHSIVADDALRPGIKLSARRET